MSFSVCFFGKTSTICFNELDLIGNKPIASLLITVVVSLFLLVEDTVDTYPGAFMKAAGSDFCQFVVTT